MNTTGAQCILCQQNKITSQQSRLKLFDDILKFQGLTSSVKTVKVKNVTISVGGAPVATLTGLSLYVKTTNMSTTPPTPGTGGTAGQGNSDPPKAFTNHALVLYNGNLYDPSYGTGLFGNLDGWEESSLAGFQYADETTTPWTYYYFSNDPATQQTQD